MSHEERYARYGGWLQTHAGKTFFFGDIQPEDICIEDIAHALSNYCRFAGHCDEFYSVAQHCCFVADLLRDCGRECQLAGLLHDSTEAYLGDVTRPLKRMLPEYQAIELKLEEILQLKFGVNWLNDPRVKIADNIALMTEARDLLGEKPQSWGYAGVEPSPIRITAWAPRVAKQRFTEYYNRLTVVDV